MEATEELEALDGLTGAQTQALIALLSQPTIKGAAKAAGIGEVTMHRWLKDSGFAAAYRQSRRQALETAIGGLQRASASAVSALERNLSCGNSAVEVRAASAVLDRAMRGAELLDLAEMVEAYERNDREDY